MRLRCTPHATGACFAQPTRERIISASKNEMPQPLASMLHWTSMLHPLPREDTDAIVEILMQSIHSCNFSLTHIIMKRPNYL